MWYVAFLRGINSGKNPTVRMVVLRKAFEGLGFRNVKTVLASGNVLFETDVADERTLERRVEQVLLGALGFETDAVIRTMDDIKHLMESEPFESVTVTPSTRLYVTFVKEGSEADLGSVPTGKGYRFLGVADGTVFSVVDLAEAKTPDLMSALDKGFGKDITTRNWNTVERIVKAYTG